MAQQFNLKKLKSEKKFDAKAELERIEDNRDDELIIPSKKIPEPSPVKTEKPPVKQVRPTEKKNAVVKKEVTPQIVRKVTAGHTKAVTVLIPQELKIGIHRLSRDSKTPISHILSKQIAAERLKYRNIDFSTGSDAFPTQRPKNTGLASFTVKMTDSDALFLKQAASYNGISISVFMEELIKKAL